MYSPPALETSCLSHPPLRLIAKLQIAAIFFMILCSSGLSRASQEAPSSIVPDVEVTLEVGDFTLDSVDGPRSLSEFRGKVVLLFFGYMNCPDVCPISLGYVTRSLSALNQTESDRVQPIYVSLDPARDDPETLAGFTRYFHESFIGLTGTPEQVSTVAKQYGVRYYQVELENSALGYAINHSAAIYLINPAGELQFVFPHQTPSPVMTDAIRHILESDS